MKMTWTTEELVQHFTIQADEREFLGSNDPHNQIGKAVLLGRLYHFKGEKVG